MEFAFYKLDPTKQALKLASCWVWSFRLISYTANFNQSYAGCITRLMTPISYTKENYQGCCLPEEDLEMIYVIRKTDWYQEDKKNFQAPLRFKY